MQKFYKGEFLTEVGRYPQNVYFIIQGIVRNSTTNRFFESGHYINHDTIMNDTVIMCLYEAMNNVTVLKYDKHVFKEILVKFPDMKEELLECIHLQ